MQESQHNPLIRIVTIKTIFHWYTPGIHSVKFRYPPRSVQKGDLHAEIEIGNGVYAPPEISFSRNSFPSGVVNSGRSRSTTTALRVATTLFFVFGL